MVLPVKQRKFNPSVGWDYNFYENNEGSEFFGRAVSSSYPLAAPT